MEGERKASLKHLTILRAEVQHRRDILDGFGQVEDVVGGFFTGVDDDQVQRLVREVTAPA